MPAAWSPDGVMSRVTALTGDTVGAANVMPVLRASTVEPLLPVAATVAPALVEPMALAAATASLVVSESY
jgi:hypothetical protein